MAAASLVARKVFLEGLVRLSDEAGLDLPKGAGTPALDAARELQRTIQMIAHWVLGPHSYQSKVCCRRQPSSAKDLQLS